MQKAKKVQSQSEPENRHAPLGFAPLGLFGDVTRGARRKARSSKHFRHRASSRVTAPIGAVTRRTPRSPEPLPQRSERLQVDFTHSTSLDPFRSRLDPFARPSKLRLT